MKKFIDPEQLIIGNARVSMHAFKACAPGFKIGHANGVFIRHPEGQITRGFSKEGGFFSATRGLAALNEIPDRFQPVKISRGVGYVLIVRQPLYAGEENSMA